MTSAPSARPTGIHHVRLTVTDIARSKSFYEDVFGIHPVVDFSDHVDEPGVREDQAKMFGGCAFKVGDHILGLRPAAPAGDSFASTRVGLDHLSLAVGSTAELAAAADRLADRGVAHGEIVELTEMGIAILSLQDPDDINLELTAAL